MSLFIKQDDQRSQLQSKLAAELQARAKQKTQLSDLPDGVEDSNYIKGMKQTTSLAWVWIIIVLVAIGLAVWLMSVGLAHK